MSVKTHVSYLSNWSSCWLKELRANRRSLLMICLSTAWRRTAKSSIWSCSPRETLQFLCGHGCSVALQQEVPPPPFVLMKPLGCSGKPWNWARSIPSKPSPPAFSPGPCSASCRPVRSLWGLDGGPASKPVYGFSRCGSRTGSTLVSLQPDCMEILGGKHVL